MYNLVSELTLNYDAVIQSGTNKFIAIHVNCVKFNTLIVQGVQAIRIQTLFFIFVALSDADLTSQ